MGLSIFTFLSGPMGSKLNKVRIWYTGVSRGRQMSKWLTVFSFSHECYTNLATYCCPHWWVCRRPHNLWSHHWALLVLPSSVAWQLGQWHWRPGGLVHLGLHRKDTKWEWTFRTKISEQFHKTFTFKFYISLPNTPEPRSVWIKANNDKLAWSQLPHANQWKLSSYYHQIIWLSNAPSSRVWHGTMSL